MSKTISPYQRRMLAYAKRREEWRKLVASGLSMAEIAKRHRISREAVRKSLKVAAP